MLSRRHWLAATVSAPALAGVRSATPPAGKKLRILVAGGHPGDPEYGVGGSILRWTAAGHDVALLYLNRGDWGFTDRPPVPAADRAVEAANACKILGARPLFADQLNGRAVVDRAHYDSFRKIVEQARADVLFTHWPLDGHADHRAAYTLVYDAWLALGRRAALYFYEVSSGEDTHMFPPGLYIDISATETRKRAACFAHASQTPERYYDLQARTSAFRGAESGCAHAEAFLRHALGPEAMLAQ
jgi:LmbE family N-acetylglucosaminyl deacetylase